MYHTHMHMHNVSRLKNYNSLHAHMHATWYTFTCTNKNACATTSMLPVLQWRQALKYMHSYYTDILLLTSTPMCTCIYMHVHISIQ